jgi:outer membrane protein OmpA-like peptidoglycan-associated protein
MNKRDQKGMPLPGISVAEFDEINNRWGDPIGLEIPGLEVNGTFYSASVAVDESFILWTLPATEGELSTNDLYVSIKQGDYFSAPQSLGAAINTTENEISPFFDSTTGLLFFSTNGRGNTDDYDIYYAKKMGDEWDNWSMPVKADINSPSFDAYFFMASDSSAYFASSRNDSISNLYVTELIIESPAEEIELVEELTTDTAETTETELAEDTRALRDPVLIIELDGQETKERSIESLSREEILDKNTVIRFVYFEYDKFNITAKYVEVLDDVAGILDKYQDVIVTINGHTDAVASEGYNQVLSENRAASTKEWLVINGVIPDRIKTAGYGEREPYASNMTEEGRSLNRRVEIFFSTE